MSVKRYFARLVSALLGRETLIAGVEGSNASVQARIALLEMDIKERDKRITEMQKEYANLQVAQEKATAGAGREEIKNLCKRLVGTLSNLDVLVSLEKSGREVAVKDLIELILSLEKELGRIGLEKIGTVGMETGFDPVFYQRMSGGSVRAGIPVVVRIPGYRMGEKILLKAMVTAQEA